jgi:galactokinase
MPENKDKIEHIFSSHADPGTYDLRGVALFGISECARSKECLEYLERGDYKGLGELMKISHNGDRVSGNFPMKITDEYLIKCSEEEADIALQPGAYGCSIPEIDALCDMLNSTDGVLGSQMLGAGLGGCIAVLVEKNKAESVLQKLKEDYYDKNGFPLLADVYLPESGSSIVF